MRAAVRRCRQIAEDAAQMMLFRRYAAPRDALPRRRMCVECHAALQRMR